MEKLLNRISQHFKCRGWGRRIVRVLADLITFGYQEDSGLRSPNGVVKLAYLTKEISAT